MRHVCLLFFSMLLLQPTQHMAQNTSTSSTSLIVGDPAWWTGSFDAHFTEAIAVVQPKGMYLKYDLYLTVGYLGGYFGQGDTLEVVYDFKLPPEAIVTDSWLWFKGNVLQGKLFDRWTARNTYEQIVNRRRDPSILYKNSATNYQLRIFPMDAAETRKVRLTFLLPMEWGKQYTQVALPMDMLRGVMATGVNPIIQTQYNPEWGLPTMGIYRSNEVMHIPLSARADSVLGTVYQQEAEPSSLPSTGTPYLRYQSPLKDGVYYGTYSDSSDIYYQLAVLPEAIFPKTEASKKVIVLLDHSNYVGAKSMGAMAQEVESLLTQNLSAQDSVHILYPSYQTQSSPIVQTGSNWRSADADTISHLLSTIPQTTIGNSNTMNLLSAGLQFYQQIGQDADLLLISNNKDYSAWNTNPQGISQHIQQLWTINQEFPPIYVVDYDQSQNQVFWDRLAFESDGYYVYEYPGQRTGMLAKGSACIAELQKIKGRRLQTYDLTAGTDSGFSHHRFTFSSTTDVPFDEVLMQTGKLVGKGDPNFDLIGLEGGNILYRQVSIPQDSLTSLQGCARQGWGYQYINLPHRNLSDIIDLSFEYRVLTPYTAFLCLEDSSYFCDTCNYEPSRWNYVWISKDPESTLLFKTSIEKAYPNPFSDRLQIDLILEAGDPVSACEFEIYDMLGQLVDVLKPTLISENRVSLEWSGQNQQGLEVPDGVYFFLLKAPSGAQWIKLIKRA